MIRSTTLKHGLYDSIEPQVETTAHYQHKTGHRRQQRQSDQSVEAELFELVLHCNSEMHLGLTYVLAPLMFRAMTNVAWKTLPEDRVLIQQDLGTK